MVPSVDVIWLPVAMPNVTSLPTTFMVKATFFSGFLHNQRFVRNGISALQAGFKQGAVLAHM